MLEGRSGVSEERGRCDGLFSPHYLYLNKKPPFLDSLSGRVGEKRVGMGTEQEVTGVDPSRNFLDKNISGYLLLDKVSLSTRQLWCSNATVSHL